MKKILIAAVLLCLNSYCYGQVSMYLRLTNYANQVLATNGTFGNSIAVKEPAIDPSDPQFMKVDSYKGGMEQALNIGSQSSGAGAGRITFAPFSVTRKIDAASPVLFQNAASGTPYKTAELYFVNAKNALFLKFTFKLVAVKTMAWSAPCDKDCTPASETVSFEYGGQVMTVYKTGADGKQTIVQTGWNRVKNIADNDPSVVLQ